MLKKILNTIKSILEPVAKTISSIVNFILLALVYFISIGLVSMFMKLFRRHFLDLEKQKKESTWHEHNVAKQPLEDYYKSF